MRKAVFIAFLLFLVVIETPAQAASQNSAAKLLSATAFKISAEDEEAGISGTIKLAVELSETGAVKDALVYLAPAWPCSSDMDKRMRTVLKDAEAAVRNFKFSPAIKGGKPVDSRIGISMKVGKAARPASDESQAKDEAKVVSPETPKTVVGGVINGKALSLPTPEYPSEAKSAGARGRVVVQVLIDESGRVFSAQILEGHGLLQFVSRAAACRAKFSPTLLSGRPVKVSGVINYNFQ